MNVLKKLWASPASILGLALGAISGGKPSIKYNAICFEGTWFGRKGVALTLGNVMLSGGPLEVPLYTYDGKLHPTVQLWQHEIAHTYQYETLGILFFPLWFLLSGASENNPLEVAADKYALTGADWWPW